MNLTMNYRKRNSEDSDIFHDLTIYSPHRGLPPCRGDEICVPQ
jgi:hypothetical protein